jgi:hypothetical protein
MRFLTLALLVCCVIGCSGGPKVEYPKDTVAAPKSAIGVGAGGGKEGGGLPVPPSDIPGAKPK